MIRIIEGIQMWLAHIAENVAGAMEAVSAQSDAQESIVSKVERLEDAVGALTGKVGQMHDTVTDLNNRLGRYLQEEAKKDVGLRTLQKDHLQLVSEVREVQKRVGGNG